MTKLIIQIPCYNEEKTLPVALAALPRDVSGADRVEWLVIDDGSGDATAEVARQAGVDHVVRLPRHQGLARAFVAGLEASLRAGADIIVNTDADNQYCADDIPKLIEPILRGEAEIVVGARPINEIKHFSPIKKLLQRAGSGVTRLISQADVQDAPSGFRAFSREAAMKLHVFNEYTYTIETVIQAGQKGMAITSVPIRINEDLRPSRLVKNLPSYLYRQLLTMMRIFVTYKPFRFFATAGVLVFLAGLLISVRFLYFYFTGNGAGHVQSLILSALLMGAGFFLAVIGLVVDLISVNRQLLEILDWRMQKIEERMSDQSTVMTESRSRDEAQ
ncbi:MAG: glycosyltransferase family 2 protein [Gemmatimonadota bacterium]|nr:MAG: glycosyltransferase family 2 protein [Gemmatimonadota bacterium]